MNPLTLEWIANAEGDKDTALREYRARRRPNYDAACFHAQQTAEKYLKAWLQEDGKDVPRIHNLVELVSLCIEMDGTFAILETDLKGWMVMRFAFVTLDRAPVKKRCEQRLN
jgi:HEPN domain-containing protein